MEAMRPLGVADLTRGPHFGDAKQRLGDHWYWCRRHERAEHVSEDRMETASGPKETRLHAACVRIGPFMSEREACRLAVIPSYLGAGHDSRPLGMEIE